MSRAATAARALIMAMAALAAAMPVAAVEMWAAVVATPAAVVIGAVVVAAAATGAAPAATGAAVAAVVISAVVVVISAAVAAVVIGDLCPRLRVCGRRLPLTRKRRSIHDPSSHRHPWQRARPLAGSLRRGSAPRRSNGVSRDPDRR